MSTLFGSNSSMKPGGTTLFGGTSLFGNQEDDNPYSPDKIQKQIDNASMRIKDAGYNANDGDQRNWFEKFTNLPDNQNAFLDTLELLGRGGNAVKNVIDKSFVKDREDAGTALYRGLAGREKVSGVDLAKQMGIDNKAGQWLVGTGLDIGLDPTTYIPGGVIAKGVGAIAKPVVGATKGIYNALEAASPALKGLREERLAPAMQSFKDGLGHMFVPQYKWEDTLFGGTDDALKNLSDRTNNTIKYQTEESLRNIGKDASTVGLDSGNDVGRIMENDLQINKNPDELLSDIIKGRDMKVNLGEGDLPDLLDKVNQRVLNSPVVAERLAKKSDQLDQVGLRLQKLDKEFDIQDARQRFENGDVLNPKEEKALERYGKYENAQKLLQQDIVNTKRGIHFNPLETNSQLTKSEGFEVNNPMPKLYKKALGSPSKFLDEVSPKATMDKVFKPEFVDTLKPVTEKLLQEGKVSIPNIKGTPAEKELRRVFGSDIQIISKKDTTITLKNRDKYYDQIQGLPEIKQEVKKVGGLIQGKLTDAAKVLKQQEEAADSAYQSISQKIAQRGGISPPRNGALTAEYRESIPLHLKSKTGIPLDEMANELGMTARDLLDSIKSKGPQKSISDYLGQAHQMLRDDEELKSLVTTKHLLESSLGQISKDVGDIKLTNRIDNINIPRPDRELSEAPLIHESAKRLMESNEQIREMAAANGIDIQGIEGYMTHILSEEARKAKRQTRVQGGNFGIGQPNKAILKNRKYDGSVEDINELHDKSLFNPNAFFSTAIGQKRLIEYIHAESFKRQVLSNRNFAVPFKKGMTVPDNAVVINPDQYKFFKVSTPDGSEFLGMGKGQEYIVTKGAKEALDSYQRLITDEGTKGFLKAFDTVQSLWKRLTLFSPGYHIRNLAGAMFNNSIAGMNVVDITKYTSEATKDVVNFVRGNETKLFNEYRKQGLSSSGLSQIEFAKAGQDPEEAIRKTVENMSKTGMSKVISKVKHPFQTSQELGDFMDQVNRFALFKWAVEKKGMSPAQAALKVKEAQFDYSKLTTFEQQVLSRVVPFYRWMRNNIPFQIRSFINDPRKYEWLNKGRTNAQEAVGLDENNVPDYMKEQFAYPVYGKGGKGQMLGLNLPLGDLTKVSNPLGTAVDGLTPLIKTPIELATNYNMFYKKPIEKFQGQEKQFNLGPLEFGLPAKVAYALEQGTGQIGRGLSSYLQKPENKDQDTAYRLPTLGINSLVKPFDAEKYKQLEQLQKLKEMQDLILYIQQQQGAKPRTVNEIKKAAH